MDYNNTLECLANVAVYGLALGILIMCFPFMIALTPLVIAWKVFKWAWFGSKLF
jgi:hypothetical protein